MRYVSLDNITEGMILGKPFYSQNGDLMLKDGVSLSEGLINRIRQMQYAGVYVRDEFSEDIQIQDIISDDLRRNSTRAVHRLMLDVGTKKGGNLQKSLDEVARMLDCIIDEILSSNQTVVNLIDMKAFDQYTYQHSVNVCVLSCVIGAAFSMPKEKLYELALASIFHDIGKMFIPKDVLDKPGKLSNQEYELAKSHSRYGYEFAKDRCRFPVPVYVSILEHHEWYNGEGYPLGKKGDDILLYARIIAVADVYDAITSRRPYHKAILPSEAYEYIIGNSGQHFSPEVVEVFSKKIAPFPKGMSVRLSNNMEGIVYENFPDCFTRPIIKLNPVPGKTKAGFIDLRNDPDAWNVTIKEVVS